jgi:hypothetical protein
MKNTKYSPVYHCLAWGVLLSPAITIYIYSSSRIDAGLDQTGSLEVFRSLATIPAVLSIISFALAIIWLIAIIKKQH